MPWRAYSVFIILSSALVLLPGGAGAETLYSTTHQLGINSAAVSDLEQLPGVTARQAEAIYEWRETRGPFRSIYELRNLLTPETFERVKPLVRIDTPWRDRGLSEMLEAFAGVVETRFKEKSVDLRAALAEKHQRFVTTLVLQDAREVHESMDELTELLTSRGFDVSDTLLAGPLARLRSRFLELITARDPSYVSTYIERLQDRLAAEESPSEAAIDEWEDLLLSPLNVNRATVDDLLLLDNVSVIDAVSVVGYIKAQGEIKDLRTLRRNVDGLSNYGYRNMQNFITISEPRYERLDFHGNYRLKFGYDNRLDVGDETENLDSKISKLDAAMFNSSTWSRLEDAGWSPEEMGALYAQLERERQALAGYPANGREMHKLRGNLGERLKFGAMSERDAGERVRTDLLKGYVGVSDLGVVDRAFLGNYRVTLGQGLIMDSGEGGLGESPYRRVERTVGLFGDLTTSEAYTLRGFAIRSKLWRFEPLLYVSQDRRDALLNPDGTVNYFIESTPRLDSQKDRVEERLTGAHLKLDLSDLGFVPLGTYIALSGYESKYDRAFNPDTATLDIPLDADQLNDPNYTTLHHGKTRQIVGGDFRTAFRNVSLEGEWGKLQGGGKAYTAKGRVQYETLYLLAMFRHYDVDYDNPYCRGFMEQRKFEDTELEKDYRLLDPLYAAMQYHPQPKAEEGMYFETRFQPHRKVTFTRIYLDTWRNLATNLPNLRVQGEIEYRPVFPVRFRLKQKWQRKHLAKEVVPTVSRTAETSLRAFAYITDRDNLSLELRYGQVGLTPTMRYGNDVLMSGGFVSGSWERNFSPRLSVRGGLVAWQTNGMSQWVFEDVGIDFLEGRGSRHFITVSDHLSPNLQMRLKYMSKVTEYPHSGIYGSDSGFYYEGQPGVPVHDFIDYQDLATYSIQLDLRW